MEIVRFMILAFLLFGCIAAASEDPAATSVDPAAGKDGSEGQTAMDPAAEGTVESPLNASGNETESQDPTNHGKIYKKVNALQSVPAYKKVQAYKPVQVLQPVYKKKPVKILYPVYNKGSSG